MTLVTRGGKGSELTWDELDDNFEHCLDRANHTGTQPASTISDFNSAAGGVASAAVAAHVAAADPHTQYEHNLTAGANVVIDRTDPANPVISAAGSAASADYRWVSAAQTGNPGSGRIGVNSSTPSAATTVYISTLTADGVDVIGTLAGANAGDALFVRQAADSATWVRYNITGAPTINTGWAAIPVLLISGGGSEPSNNTPVLVTLSFMSDAGYITQSEADARYERGLTAGTNITIDRTDPENPVISAAGGGGGGAVASVNGQTGVVVLDTDDVAEGVSNLYYTNARASAAAPVQSVNGQTGAVDLSGSYAPLSHVGSGGAAHANVVAGGAAGFMTGADKTKLDSIAAGAQVNVPTNLTTTTSATTLTVNSDTGTDATLPAATTSVAGVMTAADKTKLDGIAPGATANATDAQLRDRSTHTGTQTASTISDLTEAVQDIAGAAVVAGTNVTVNYNDTTGQITISATSGGADNSTETVAISSGTLNLSATTKEVIVVDLNQNVTTITLPSGAAGQAINRRIVFTQSGAANFTVAGWGSVTIEGGSAPVAATGVGAVTEYMLSNTSNGGWRMYVDQGVTLAQVGQLGGFRNKLINGNFQINQRTYASGTATTGANQYTLDRWRVVTSGQNLAFTASGNGNQITAPAGGIEQVIEGINIEGGTYVLNWTGTATATVNGTARTKGETFTLTPNTNVTVRFIGGTVSLAQLELGTVVTPFESRPYGVELALCQRYYQVLPSKFTVCGTASGVSWTVRLPVTMRTQPAIAHSYTDASFVADPAPGAGQWALHLTGVTVISKSGGTISVGAEPLDLGSVAFNMYGMTLSGVPNNLVCSDPTFYPRLSAEL